MPKMLVSPSQSLRHFVGDSATVPLDQTGMGSSCNVSELSVKQNKGNQKFPKHQTQLITITQQWEKVRPLPYDSAFIPPECSN